MFQFHSSSVPPPSLVPATTVRAILLVTIWAHANFLEIGRLFTCLYSAGFASVKADDKVPHTGLPGTRFERTFIAIKPDGVQRGIVGEIIQRFEKKGYKLVGLKVGINAPPPNRRSAQPAQDSDSPLHLLAPRRSSSPPSSSPSSTTLISRRSLSSPAW